jgi:hypothetical protein
VAQDTDYWLAIVGDVMNLLFPWNVGNLLSISLTSSLLRKPLLLKLGIGAFIFWYLAKFSAQKKDLIGIKIHITIVWG